MKGFRVRVLIVAGCVFFLPALLIGKPKPHPQNRCSASAPNGNSCSVDCPSGSDPQCAASATEAHCACGYEIGSTGIVGNGRVLWGPVTGVTGQQIFLCNDFAAFLRSNTILSSRTSLLATDVDSTVAAVVAGSQSRYHAASDAYMLHARDLTGAERDSIAAWRSRNNPWASKPVGRYVSNAGSEISLSAVVPNPFRESTTVTYALPTDTPVRVAVYDSRGTFITTLEAGEQNAGQYTLRWDGTDEQGRKVAAGTYLLRLTTLNATRVQKMEIVR